MERIRQLVSILFGIMCVYLATWGIYYVSSYYIALLDRAYDPETPYFTLVYNIMASINLLLFVFVLMSGFLYIKNKARHWYLLIVPICLYQIYDYTYIKLTCYEINDLCMSVAAATGVSGGGSVLLDQIYFWVWAPMIALALRFMPLTSPGSGQQKLPSA